MKGLLDGVELPAVSEWLRAAAATRERVLSRADAEPLNAAIEENVLVQLERARRFPCVAEAVEAGRLTLHGWIYDIETAAFRAFDEATGAFVPLSESLRRSA